MILAKPNIQTDYKELEIVEFSDNNTPFQTLITEFAKNGAVIWLDGIPAYLDEIRADYVNKEIYIPIYKYDMIDDVEYNCRIEKNTIHSFNNGYELDYIIVQPNIISNVAYRIFIKGRKLVRELTEDDYKAVDLFNRYIAYSYGYTKFEHDVFKYKAVKKSNLTSSKRKKLKDLGLEYYGEYLDTDYRDVRRWRLDELINKFSGDRLQMDRTFEVRRMNFELELYTRICSNTLWTGWTDGTISELLNDKREFIKYKENSIYLIFKKKWLSQ